MSRCRNMVDIGRRQFLRGGALAPRALVWSSRASARHRQEPLPLRPAWTIPPIVSPTSRTSLNEPFDVAYPDEDASGVLLKLGTRVEGGSVPMATSSAFLPSVPTRAFR